jgi:hypothetical protein
MPNNDLIENTLIPSDQQFDKEWGGEKPGPFDWNPEIYGED